MPPTQITRKNIAAQSVTFTPRSFDTANAKASEARMFFSFTAANLLTVMPHSLGKIPTSWTIVASGSITGPAGNIYSDQPLAANRSFLGLKCDAANTWAEVVVR